MGSPKLSMYALDMPYADPKSPEAIDAARAARRKHYEANREQYYANNRLKKERMVAYVNELKSEPCTDCGVSYHPYVMDFDHVEGEKVSNIAKLVRSGSWSKLKTEIAKCELVCSNCHRLRTLERRMVGDEEML